MQSKNPVFTRSSEFNGKGGSYATSPSQWSVGTPGLPGTHQEVGTGPMTIDSVVQKTGITLGVVILAAAITWLVTGDPSTVDVNGQNTAIGTLYVLSMIGAFGGFALSLVNSFKKVISPALVIGYAALEGVFIGAFSKVIGAQFGTDGNGMGIIMGAVLGTVAATAGTLAAYKFLNIQVNDKFRKWVTAMMFGFVAVSLLDLVLSMFHSSFGFNGFGTMGLLSSVVGLGIGVLMLIMDFDFVERGIAAGLPERESWRAAFGLTVTIVWIYIELLRILAILNRR